MYRKRIILILTSRDESDDISQKIAEAIRKIGTHNAVVMSDDKYGSCLLYTSDAADEGLV